MKLSEFGVKRPVAAVVLFAGVVAMGLFSLSRLNVDLTPKIDIPAVTVVTVYPGAGPREVEQRITKVLESELASVSGLDKMESLSQESVSMITLRFQWGQDLTEATNDIRDQVARARKKLPASVETPYVSKFDLAQMPILVMGFSATGASRAQLRDVIDDRIVEPLKRVDGVGKVSLVGGARREIRVELDRRRLKATGVSINRVMKLLAASNVSVPGGHLKLGRSDYILRVPGEYTRVADIGTLVVGVNGKTGAPVHLNEIARVRDTFQEKTQVTRLDGHTGVAVVIRKQSNANTVLVAAKVQGVLNTLAKTLPADVQMVVVRDTSLMISRTIDNLKRTLAVGGVLVIVVLLVFLRNFRVALIAALSIPTSLIATFLLMYAFDYTLNMMSLMSLVIAIGMVVDVSIVVLENIQRHRESGARTGQAAIHGTEEMGSAVVASTVTTIAIFVPVLFAGGIIGIFFKQLAVIITMALIASLAAALVLVPALASKLPARRKHGRVVGWLFNQSERVFVWLERSYAGLLGWSLRHRLAVLLGIAVVCGSTLLLVPRMKTAYFPEQDSGFVTVQVELPAGTRLSETSAVMRRMSKKVQTDVHERAAYFGMWGADRDHPEISRMMGMGNGTNYGLMMVRLNAKDKRQRSSKKVARDLRPFLESFPATKVSITAEDALQSLLTGSGKPVSVEVRGHDEKTAFELAEQVARRLKGIEGLTDVEIGRKRGLPELQVIVDRERAATLGLNVAQIAMTVRQAFNGARATQYRVGGDEYNVYVQLRPEDRKRVDDLSGLTMRSVTGRHIPLGSVAKVVRSTGPVSIERKNQTRVIKVSANLQGRDLGSASKDIRRELASMDVPPSFELHLGGSMEEQQKSFKQLLLALLLGIALVYMVMAVQFGSLRDPFIILFAIPFALVGALWAFIITGETLSVLSFVGMIMLVGIVVNNGIVLVDYIKILRARGVALAEAVKLAGQHRLRPVLMTAFTTIFGVLPMALNTGQGAELWRGMAVAIIGGLAVSTVVTLVFVPVLYHVFQARAERRALAKMQAAAPQIPQEVTP